MFSSGLVGTAVALTMLGVVPAGPATAVSAPSGAPAVGAAVPAQSTAAKVKPRRLVLVVKGDRLGKKAKIVVKGAKGRAKGVKKTALVKKRRTLKRLNPGLYRVSAKKIAVEGRTSKPKKSRQKVRVRAKRGAAVTIRYRRIGVPPGSGGTPTAPTTPPSSAPTTPPPTTPPPTTEPPTTQPPDRVLSRKLGLQPGTSVAVDINPELVSVSSLDSPASKGGVSLRVADGSLLVDAAAGASPGTVSLSAAGTGCTALACDIPFTMTVAVAVEQLAAPPGRAVDDFLEPSPDRVARAEIVSPAVSALVDEATVVVGGAGDPRAIADAAAQAVGAVVVGGDADSRAFQLRWPSRQDIRARLTELVALAGVRSAEAGLLIETEPTVVGASDEPAYGGDAWNLDAANAPAAWAVGATGSGVTIGILEAREGSGNGMVAEHEDLPAVSYGEARGGESFHATHVAGLACAQDNGTGVIGVAPECALVSSQLGTSGLLQGTLDLLQEQVDAGARVINNSWGLVLNCSARSCRQRDLEDLQRGREYFVGQTNSVAAWLTGPGADTVVVASAGNAALPANTNVITWAGRLGGARNAITVAATDRNGNLSYYSNFGPEVDIAAPGGDNREDRLMSTLPGDEYGKKSGTSMAAPMVAGAAALVAQKHPDLDGAAIADCLRSSATSAVTARNDEDGLFFAFGGSLRRLDAGAAVQCGYNPDTLAAGFLHTCALDTTGKAWCWGSDGSGRLGDGDDGQADEYAPVAVAGGHRFTRLTAGYNHTCGIDDAGAAWCWGGDDFGQVGDGDTNQTTFVYAPVAVAGGHRFTRLAAGDYHTCGIDDAGKAWCWGSDFDGQIGDGDDGQANEFAPVAVSVAAARTFTSIAAGGSHTCGIDTLGKALCWGRNTDGQLGFGDDGQAAKYAPVAVAGPGGRRFTRLAAGGRHSCGVDTLGRTWCWGADNFGQVGDGGGDQATKFTATLVAGGRTFTRLAAGGSHTCGIDNAYKAWCWGYDIYGEVGDGDGDQGAKSAPVPVAGGHPTTHLAAGNSHTCSIDTKGAARCWGWDFYGQVGDGAGDQSAKYEPTAVAGGRAWKQG